MLASGHAHRFSRLPPILFAGGPVARLVSDASDDQDLGPGVGDGTSWRDVSVEQFRRYNLISTVLGVLLFGAGLGILILYTQLILGLTLIAVGSAVGLWTSALRVDGMPAVLMTERDVVATDTERWAPRVFHFYTREGCTLCLEAYGRLQHELEGKGVSIVMHDVDRDPVLQRRYGERVPVAVFDGGEVFALEYDEAAVRAAVRGS